MTEYVGTGTCWEDAALAAWALYLRGESGEVVHGLCIFPPNSPDAGATFAHAWIEADGKVWEPAIHILTGSMSVGSADARIFYLAYQVHRTTRFSLRQFVRLAWQHGTPGPWDEIYLQHCAPPPTKEEQQT